jgi:mannose-6-phosphate isomerase-like protein (cupin superfamily)
MNTLLPSLLITLVLTKVAHEQQNIAGYVLEREKEIGVEQPGPHDGGGRTTAYSFFANVPNCKLVFRKRVLHPGSAIGYHLQERDEVYYIVSGAGEMKMNGKTFPVVAGDAILTRPGSSHGLKHVGTKDLVLFIAYYNERLLNNE